MHLQKMGTEAQKLSCCVYIYLWTYTKEWDRSKNIKLPSSKLIRLNLGV